MKHAHEVNLVGRINAMILEASEHEDDTLLPSTKAPQELIAEALQDAQLTDPQYAAFQAIEARIQARARRLNRER
jgi:hypothetical protein